MREGVLWAAVVKMGVKVIMEVEVATAAATEAAATEVA